MSVQVKLACVKIGLPKQKQYQTLAHTQRLERVTVGSMERFVPPEIAVVIIMILVFIPIQAAILTAFDVWRLGRDWWQEVRYQLFWKFAFLRYLVSEIWQDALATI